MYGPKVSFHCISAQSRWHVILLWIVVCVVGYASVFHSLIHCGYCTGPVSFHISIHCSLKVAVTSMYSYLMSGQDSELDPIMCEMHSVPGGKTNSLKASCMFSPNFPLPSFFEKWYKRQLRTDRLAVKERLSDLLLTESPLFLSFCVSLILTFVPVVVRLWRMIALKARRRWRMPQPKWRPFPTRLLRWMATKVKRNLLGREQQEEEGT